MKSEKLLSIVVPYRNREEHLGKFIPYMEEFFAKSHIPYHIWVIHQLGDKPFNRAKLLNVGYRLSDSSDYHAFHDVDMLPVDSDYSYIDAPTHLASQVEQFGWGLPYEGYFGGVTLFNKHDFARINGYSNNYWGWGAEDDDLFTRCIIAGLSPCRKECRYVSLSHKKASLENYHDNLTQVRKLRADPTEARIMADGLSTLDYSKKSQTDLTAHATIVGVDL